MAELRTELPSFAAIILAGGLGRRMGYQQKGLMPLHQRPLLSYTLDKVQPYTRHIVISANKSLAEYRDFGYPVVSDLETYAMRGPLAGIYSAISTLPNDIEYVQVLPCDTPYLPDELVSDFYHFLINEPDKEMVIAATESKEHPVIMQLKMSVMTKLKDYLDGPRELNRVMTFIESCDYGTIKYSNSDQFTNINDISLLPGNYQKGQ